MPRSLACMFDQLVPFGIADLIGYQFIDLVLPRFGGRILQVLLTLFLQVVERFLESAKRVSDSSGDGL